MNNLEYYAVNKYLWDHLEINSTYINSNFFIFLPVMKIHNEM